MVQVELHPIFLFLFYSKSGFPGFGLIVACGKLDCSNKDDAWFFLIHTRTTPSRKLS